MRSNKIKTNVTIINKVDSREYKIINVDGAGDSVKGTAKLVKDDGTLDDSVTSVITPANAIAYRLVEDPNIPAVPLGYSVEGGMLLKDGTQVTEQGSLIIDEIITAVAGRLILAVVPREPRDGYIDLFSYTPETDKFNKLIRNSIPRVRIIGLSEDKNIVALVYSRTYSKDKILESGETVTETLFDSAAVLSYVVKDDAVYSSKHFDMPIKAINNVKNHRGYFELAVEVDTDVNEYGVISESEDTHLTILKINHDGIINVIDNYRVASAPEMIAETAAGFVIKLPDRIYINGYKYPVKNMSVLSGYDYLVDITKKEHEIRCTLADENMSVKTLIVTSTKDRGNIVTVE